MKRLYLKGNKVYAEEVENIFTDIGLKIFCKNIYIGRIRKLEGKFYFDQSIFHSAGEDCLKRIIKILKFKTSEVKT